MHYKGVCITMICYLFALSLKSLLHTSCLMHVSRGQFNMTAVKCSGLICTACFLQMYWGKLDFLPNKILASASCKCGSCKSFRGNLKLALKFVCQSLWVQTLSEMAREASLSQVWAFFLISDWMWRRLKYWWSNNIDGNNSKDSGVAC